MHANNLFNFFLQKFKQLGNYEFNHIIIILIFRLTYGLKFSFKFKLLKNNKFNHITIILYIHNYELIIFINLLCIWWDSHHTSLANLYSKRGCHTDHTCVACLLTSSAKHDIIILKFIRKSL